MAGPRRPAGMRRAFIAAGTLGGGTLFAFVLAALAFLADPIGRSISPTNAWPVPVMGAPAPAVLVDPAVPQPMPAPDLVMPAPGGPLDGVAEPAAREEMLRAIKEELAREASGG